MTHSAAGTPAAPVPVVARLTALRPSSGRPPVPVADAIAAETAAQRRVAELLAANQSIVGELSLPLVLRRIVEAAAKVAGAHYAALGVLGPDGMLEQFVHTGMDDAAVERIGHLPEGRGVLGAVIADRGAIRLDTIADDPRSSGFPPGHPPMTSFLGVPVRVRDVVYGNLYLSDRSDGHTFSDEDVDLVAALAATAGVAIENARLYEESGRRQEWLQASSTITRELLAGTGDRLEVLEHIADSVRHLARADVVTLVLPCDDPDSLEVAVATGLGAESLAGSRFAADNSLALQVMQDGRGVLIGALEDYPRTRHLDCVVPSGPVMALPLTGDWSSRGAVVIGRTSVRSAFNQSDLEMAGGFAEQAALALELAEARADQQRLTALEERERIGRDLHDHVIQRLFASGLGAQSLVERSGEPAVREGLTQMIAELTGTIRQIRSTIFALRDTPPETPSLRRVVGLLVAQLTPMLGFRPDVHLAGPLDTLVDERLLYDVEAVLREAMTNISRHAGATAAAVLLDVDSRRLMVVVSDNGRGNHGSTRWSGLANLEARAQQQGGTLVVDDAPEGGLRVTWTIPITL